MEIDTNALEFGKMQIIAAILIFLSILSDNIFNIKPMIMHFLAGISSIGFDFVSHSFTQTEIFIDVIIPSTLDELSDVITSISIHFQINSY